MAQVWEWAGGGDGEAADGGDGRGGERDAVVDHEADVGGLLLDGLMMAQPQPPATDLPAGSSSDPPWRIHTRRTTKVRTMADGEVSLRDTIATMAAANANFTKAASEVVSGYARIGSSMAAKIIELQHAIDADLQSRWYDSGSDSPASRSSGEGTYDGDWVCPFNPPDVEAAIDEVVNLLPPPILPGQEENNAAAAPTRQLALMDDADKWLPYCLTPGWHNNTVPAGEEEEVAVALPAVAGALQIVGPEIEVAEQARTWKARPQRPRQAFPVPPIHLQVP